MKKPHNKTNLLLGLMAFGGAMVYALLKEIGLLVVGGFFAAWTAAEIFLNLLAETKSDKNDIGGILEKAAADAAKNSAVGMGIGIRGGGMTPTMSPTGNIQLDDHKKLLPITWGIILILYWWMPILVFDATGASGPVQLFSEPLLLLPPVVLAALDFWMLKKK